MKNILSSAFFLVITLGLVLSSLFVFNPNISEFQWEVIWNTSKILWATVISTFVIGEITNNNSQVDKIWSIIPLAYVGYIAAQFNWSPRAILMFALVCIWGIRLSFNFARRGGYSWKFWEGDEDYRWEILRNKPPLNNKWVWTLFNFGFICLYQNVLIFLFSIPIVKALENGGALQTSDYLLAFVFITLILIETVADQQQWNFHKKKKDPQFKNHGFIEYGLWGIVRHPNYAAEQSIWIVFYLFGAFATGHWINWSIIGSVLLVILFKSSSDFSEGISTQKYPEYKTYQKRTPRFIPFTKFNKNA